MKYDIYLAAPLFSNAERNWNGRLKRHLESAGLTVFAPQDEMPAGKNPANIYKACIRGLRQSRMLVAVLDGPDADSGTSWEAGFSTASGMPVVAVRTDFRKCEFHYINIMLHYSCTKLIQREGTPDEQIFALVGRHARILLRRLQEPGKKVDPGHPKHTIKKQTKGNSTCRQRKNTQSTS